MAGDSGNDRIYIHMMVDSLKKKESTLRILYDLTKQQHDVIGTDEIDTDALEQLLEKKGARIEELTALDEGFDSVFQRVEKVLLSNASDYKAEIVQMKESVTAITEISSKIQILEKRNNEQFALYMDKQKKQVRNANINQKTISSYMQNKAGAHQSVNSYFFNETK